MARSSPSGLDSFNCSQNPETLHVRVQELDLELDLALREPEREPRRNSLQKVYLTGHANLSSLHTGSIHRSTMKFSWYVHVFKLPR